MTNDQVNDLKQFILGAVSQATANMATKSDIANMATKDDIADLKADIARVEQKLERKMIDVFAGVADVVEGMNNHAARRERSLDRRITKLERQAA